MKVIPAPLEPTLDKFSAQMMRLLPYFKRFSIDILDGIAVPTKNITVKDVITFFKGTPDLPDIVLDFDLMVSDYEAALNDISELKQYVRIGNIVILKSSVGKSPVPTRKDLAIGLSLNAHDEVSDLEYIGDLNILPCIQVMTIEAGGQGRPFIPDELLKIDQLRNANYRNLIYIDGAVNHETLPAISTLKNRPDFLCVGSYLTRSEDKLEERVNYLRSIES